MTSADSALLGLVADLRAALGDPEGRLMQAELIARAQQMAAELDNSRRLMDRYHSALLLIYQHGRTIDDARETARVALEQNP